MRNPQRFGSARPRWWVAGQVERRSALWLALAAMALGAGVLRAGDAQPATDPAVDSDFLEFLGSVDPSSDAAQPDDGAWLEYLSQTDIGKVVKPAGTPKGADPKAAAPPPKPSTSNQG